MGSLGSAESRELKVDGGRCFSFWRRCLRVAVSTPSATQCFFCGDKCKDSEPSSAPVTSLSVTSARSWTAARCERFRPFLPSLSPRMSWMDTAWPVSADKARAFRTNWPPPSRVRPSSWIVLADMLQVCCEELVMVGGPSCLSGQCGSGITVD